MRRVPDPIWEIAFDQYGVFSAAQAVAAGVRAQSMPKLLAIGAIHRVYRGVYRVDAYPTGDQLEYDGIQPWQIAAAALWVRGEPAVIGGRTALRLSETSNYRSDAPQIEIIVPTKLRITRDIPPEILILRADLERVETKSFAGALRVTKLGRTLRDCLVGVEDRYLMEAIVRGRKRFPSELLLDEAVELAECINAPHLIPQLRTESVGTAS